MTIPGAFNAGDVLTASNMNLLPAGRIGSASITADQTSISTMADITSLTVTFTAITGRLYLITGKIDFLSSVADGVWGFYVTNSANTQQNQATGIILSTNSHTGIVHAVVQPTSGSVTYKLRMERVSGTGTYTMQASSTRPAFILVQDLGVA